MVASIIRFLGDIKVAGLSIKQVESFITAGLKGDYLINPNVYVQVIEYRPFYIHGEVKKNRVVTPINQV